MRVTVPDGTRLDASVDAGSISAEHSWDQVQVHADAGSIVIGTLRDGSVRAQAGSVRIRSTTGTVSAHTEAGSVKVLADPNPCGRVGLVATQGPQAREVRRLPAAPLSHDEKGHHL